MSSPPAPFKRFRWRRAARIVLALGVVALVAWQVRVHTSAWGELKAGRAALDRDDPESARRHFERCLEEWPQSGEVNLLAAGAARRCGDFGAAEKYLTQADRLGCAAADIEVEYALIRAQSGHLDEAESALLHHLKQGHPQGPQILAVLIPLYASQFRWSEADSLGAKWVQLAPGSARAWKAHAAIQERLQKTDAALDALRRVVELTPDDRKARSDLVRLVLETRQPPDEAAGHAEWLTQTDPRDATALVQLAECREAQSRTGDAVVLLDRVIAEHPPDPKVFYLRGRLAMARGAATALPFLRRAVALDRSDPDIRYWLFVCLQQVGTPAQASEAEKQWRQCAADLRRAGELGAAISAAPHDPELRREMGELFLRNGRDADGLRWLESALRERPDHAPTHRALAAYYERLGRPDLARRHSAQVPAQPRGNPDR
jgi:tetratricopeptide (TPR) repeat protein